MGYEGGLRRLLTRLVLRGYNKIGCVWGCPTRGKAICKLDLFNADSKLSLPAIRMN